MLKKIVLAGIVIGLICSTSIAREEADTTVPGVEFALSKDKIRLDGKGDDYVLFCKRRFDVTSYTLIKSDSGLIISLDALKVPCEALVSYYKKPRSRNKFVAVSIEVLGPIKPTPE
jgi:hypothetical protein